MRCSNERGASRRGVGAGGTAAVRAGPSARPLGPLPPPAGPAGRAGRADPDRRRRLPRARARRPTDTAAPPPPGRGRRAGRDAASGWRSSSRSRAVLLLPGDGAGPDRRSPAARMPGSASTSFHYHTGPEQARGPGRSPPANLAWVQLCDLSGTPRELAGDSDRILPGDGDFPLGPIVDHWRGSATKVMSRSRCSTRSSGRSPPIAWPTSGIRPRAASSAVPRGVGRRAGRADAGPDGTGRRTLSVSSVATLQPAAASSAKSNTSTGGSTPRSHRSTSSPGSGCYPERLVARAARGARGRRRAGPVPRLLPAADDHRGHADRRSRLVRLDPDLPPARAARRRPPDRDGDFRPIADYGVWGIAPAAMATRPDRPRQPGGPARAGRRLVPRHRQPAARGARANDPDLLRPPT